MPVRQVAIHKIEVGPRMREVSGPHVLALADSIDQIGLQVPITVCKLDDVYELVAGRHRLDAVEQLGWEYILANITSLGDMEQQLWEIDENLCRAELSTLERAQHLQKRKSLWEAHESSGQTLPETPPSGGRPAGFAAATEAATGIPKRTVNQDLRRVERIPEDVQEVIASTPIAKVGVELDALASAEPVEQRAAVRAVLDGDAELVREVLVKPDDIMDTAGEGGLAALQKAWREASTIARSRFLRALDEVSLASISAKTAVSRRIRPYVVNVVNVVPTGRFMPQPAGGPRARLNA